MGDVDFRANPVRGRLNAAFFSAVGGYIDQLSRERKAAIFRDLAEPVIELGPGVGANFRYLPPGTRVIAVEPNPHMHDRLRRSAAEHDVDLDLRSVVGERIDVEDEAAGSVISSLVLCTVADPVVVLGEVHRVLRTGGRYAFLEHVVAPEGTLTRRVQRAVAAPWAWAFEGCSCQRDLAPMLERAGFSALDVRSTMVRSPFVPANPQISGVATK